MAKHRFRKYCTGNQDNSRKIVNKFRIHSKALIKYFMTYISQGKHRPFSVETATKILRRGCDNEKAHPKTPTFRGFFFTSNFEDIYCSGKVQV